MIAAAGERAAPSLRRARGVPAAGAGARVTAMACASAAHASPAHVLRFATAAPDGTACARRSRTFARDVEEATDGDVQIKWYFGGIAGEQDDALLGSLFGTHGAHRVELSRSCRAELLDAARAARLEHGHERATQKLLDEINEWLADFRSDHQ